MVETSTLSDSITKLNDLSFKVVIKTCPIHGPPLSKEGVAHVDQLSQGEGDHWVPKDTLEAYLIVIGSINGPWRHAKLILSVTVPVNKQI